MTATWPSVHAVSCMLKRCFLDREGCKKTIQESDSSSSGYGSQEIKKFNGERKRE